MLTALARVVEGGGRAARPLSPTPTQAESQPGSSCPDKSVSDTCFCHRTDRRAMVFKSSFYVSSRGARAYRGDYASHANDPQQSQGNAYQRNWIP
jgi:hypothetical protein